MADFLKDRMDVRALVPDVYAAFRPIVSDALVFFIEHLSPARLTQVLREQAALPPNADASTRLVHLMHACQALHKLGQVVARHRELDVTLRRRLQRLETMVPTTAMSRIRPIIEHQLKGAITKYRIRLAATPLAEASVAVVVPFVWSAPEDRNALPGHGVFKVLKPGIGRRMQEDLEILAGVADHLDKQREAYRLPMIAYRETFDEVRKLLRHEVHLSAEQTHLEAAAEQFYGRRDVLIPQLLPFSTPEITAMERVFGVKVTELGERGREPRDRLARTIARCLVADVIFSRRSPMLFHADPHAGNLMATTDHRLAILDWSLCGHLRNLERAQLAQIAVGALTGDAGHIGRTIEELASGHPNEQVVRRLVVEALAELRGDRLPGPHWIMQLLDRLAIHGVRFPSDLLLFRKVFFTLEGVIADVSPDVQLDPVLVVEALKQLISEWPGRALRPAMSREYATHLSNADLLQIGTALPYLLQNVARRTWGDWEWMMQQVGTTGPWAWLRRRWCWPDQ